MPGSLGGPYQYFNVTDGTITIPRHDGSGVRTVRGGESFYGPAFYDRFVRSGLLARTSAEVATVVVPVYPQDLIPAGTAAIESDGTWSLPPHRYQRGLDELTVPPVADSVVTNSCVGLPKIRLSFAADSSSDDTVHATYYFYASSLNPRLATHVVEVTQVLGSGWAPPRWAGLPSGFYALGPHDQAARVMDVA